MPCYKPLVAYYNKSEVYFKPQLLNKAHTYDAKKINLPCGRCIGCRLAYARNWAIRCSKEASMHKVNCFITLTYDNDHLPANGSLQPKDFQLFMKRLRKKVGQLRFFHCGEYGDKYKRPHYHALIFGYDFPDREIVEDCFKKYRNLEFKYKLYQSKLLENLWGKGRCIIGDLTFESASYCARYMTKKLKGSNKYDYPNRVYPEYATMSRKPGIGHDWYQKRGWSDCHANDRVAIMRNSKTHYYKPPRYFDDLLKEKDYVRYEFIKELRIKNYEDLDIIIPKHNDQDLDRECKFADNQFKKLIRQYED